MRKSNWKIGILPLLLLIFIATQKLNSQSLLSGSFQSDEIYSRLLEADLSPRKQSLVPVQESSFPENIIISLNSSQTNSFTLIFAFSQKYIQQNMENFINFVKNLQIRNLTYNLEILLSADDNKVDFGENKVLFEGGTYLYASNLEDFDTSCAVVIDDTTIPSYEIIAGGGGDTSPSWLVKLIKNSCSNTGVNGQLSISFISFYKNQILKESDRVSSFLSQGIAAAGLGLPGNEKDFEILTEITNEIQSAYSTKWDRNYAFIPFGNSGIWIGESFFAISYLFISLITLFILCFFTFLVRADNEGYNLQMAHKKDTLRLCYFIPLIILFSTVLLSCTEKIFTGIRIGFFALVCWKLTILIIFSTIGFITQLRLSYRISSYACSFLMIIMAVTNIFLFSTIDLSLVFLFFLEYLLILIASKMTKTIPILISLLLMTSPFIPYLQNLILSVSDNGLNKLAKIGFTGNLSLSCALFPFLIQYNRFLISINLFNKEHHSSLKKTILQSSILIFSTIFLVLIVNFIVSYNVQIRQQKNQKQSINVINSSETEHLSLTVSDSDFMDLNIRQLSLNTDIPVIRYLINIKTEDQVPLYDCNFEYILDTPNSAYIKIPDYPTDTLNIIYSTDTQYNSTITVEYFFEKDINTVYKEQKVITIKGVRK